MYAQGKTKINIRILNNYKERGYKKVTLLNIYIHTYNTQGKRQGYTLYARTYAS